MTPADSGLERHKVSKGITGYDEGLFKRRVEKSREHVRQVMILFLKFENKRFDRDIEMLGQGFLEADELQADPVAIVERVDLVDTILEMNLILVDDSRIGGTSVGNDINVLELQMGLLKGEGDCGEGDSGGKLDAVVPFFFGSGD